MTFQEEVYFWCKERRASAGALAMEAKVSQSALTRLVKKFEKGESASMVSDSADKVREAMKRMDGGK